MANSGLKHPLCLSLSYKTVLLTFKRPPMLFLTAPMRCRALVPFTRRPYSQAAGCRVQKPSDDQASLFASSIFESVVSLSSPFLFSSSSTLSEPFLLSSPPLRVGWIATDMKSPA